MGEERWVPINGYEEYLISDHGRVVSLRTGARVFRVLVVNTNGYQRVSITYSPKKCVFLYIHRLVAEHFVSGREPSLHVAHLDGNRLNNNFKNLIWCTRKENDFHKIAHGTRLRGVKNASAKISEQDVLNIRARLKIKPYSSEEIKQLAKIHNITTGHLRDICNGKRWSWLEENK